MAYPYIEAAIRAVGANQLTDIFLILLVLIFLLSMWWKRADHHNTFTTYAPTLLTSLGILGTFAGIIAGLLEFDTDHIDASIGPLLDGLKTAFTTSLAGMFLSILYKAIVSTGFLKRADAEILAEDEVGAAELYAVMQQQVAGIEQLKQAISDNDESSLVSQIKLLRSEISDNNRSADEKFEAFQEQLWSELKNFADILAKAATEQVIEALQQVIQDFNTNLTKQFGDNFAQLNEAVGRLLEWQENYKGQLSDMKDQYDLAVLAITETEASVARIGEAAQSIPASMKQLQEVMNGLQEIVAANQYQIGELDRHLEAFADIKNRAVEAIPAIREQVAMIDQTAEQEIQRVMESMGSALASISGQFTDDYQQLVAQMQAIVNNQQP